MSRSGERFGRYEIRSKLGAGGMGEVFLAFDTVLHRLVALKIVRRDKDRPEAALRLVSEARAAAALKHPNVVTLLDAGEIDGVPFLAMEYVEGKTLRACMGEDVAVGTKLDWLRQLASALAAAHAIAIIHRDVKPDNVIVSTDGAIKILDFGIAKRLVATDTSAPTSDEPLSVRTAEGRVVGTSAYMAPEQRAGGAPNPAWDQFAWGMTSYEVMTGLRPTGRAAPLLNAIVPDVSFDVAVIVARAMAHDPGQRHESMDEIARALGSAASAKAVPSQTRSKPSAKRRSPVAVLAVSALALLTGASAMFAWSRNHAAPRSPAPVEETQSMAATPSSRASTTLPLAVPPPPSTAASEPTAVSHQKARGKFGCQCRSHTPPIESLCPKERLTPADCHCDTPGGQRLCAVPYTGVTWNPLVCAQPSFGLTWAAREGDPCDGYNGDTKGETLLNTHAKGTLTTCQVCRLEDLSTYFASEGSSCIGYRADRVPLSGTVDCDNLRLKCDRGDDAACSDLPLHK